MQNGDINKLKEVDINNRTCYYFDDEAIILRSKDFMFLLAAT